MSKNKSYLCRSCKTVYDQLPDNRDGEHQCGNCLNIGNFEETDIPETELILRSVIYQLLEILKMLHIFEQQLKTITKQLKQIQFIFPCKTPSSGRGQSQLALPVSY